MLGIITFKEAKALLKLSCKGRIFSYAKIREKSKSTKKKHFGALIFYVSKNYFFYEDDVSGEEAAWIKIRSFGKFNDSDSITHIFKKWVARVRLWFLYHERGFKSFFAFTLKKRKKV